MISSEACLRDLSGIARKVIGSEEVRRSLVADRIEQYQHDLQLWVAEACARAGEFSMTPLTGGLKETLRRTITARRQPERELEVLEYAYSLL
jgi:hypothetical protein